MGDDKVQTVRTAEGGSFTWPANADVVPVGDHGMPEHLIYRHEGGDQQPGCVIELEVRGGEPVCMRAELIGKPDSRIPVQPRDLRALARMIDPVIEGAGVIFGFSRAGATGWGLASPASIEEERARLRSVRASRRRIDNPVFLKEVADLYSEAPKPKLEYVADELECSQRSASRYVVAAREAGLIDE